MCLLAAAGVDLLNVVHIYLQGALARSVWVAPLGAMNFGAYELAKKAMSQRDQQGQEGGAVAAVAQQTEDEA